ncbi:malto-oligosyltrehalose synthase [Maribellus maritimus]|uniref:malto-oligosyltrehalose synthase n=1 Tax=Maribellus maritimus TaxID=2870838 RepID=UPI001EEA21EB|nr:malto-oligosyltrehalose synthase [Maribellus maritimus]MCG6188881.1 malto-oligosyltrehalose synthase [Maribellus maritimus]
MTKYNPVTTYRLQFNKEFTLNDAEKILPYLNQMGIRTIYSSPLFQAIKGSSHGYDVTNPLLLNPEIGTKNDLESFIRKLRKLKMGLLLDIVPNHMAFSVENPWIYDVLEKGKDSAFYSFFDILKNQPNETAKNQLMLPFFGKPPEQMIEERELSVGIGKNGFKLNYFDTSYPVSVSAFASILNDKPEETLPATVTELLNAVMQNKNFGDAYENLLNEYSSKENTRSFIDKCLSAINNNPEKIKELINHLSYQPAFWKDTEQKINYRRFFTINGLICVNVQDKAIFSTTHNLLKKWIDSNVVQGVRVDHIDGLFNPSEYLERLRDLTGNDAYVVVEKILEKEEDIPENWPVEGTTGYDFLALVNNLLTNPEKGHQFYLYYNQWIDKSDDFSDVFYRKNRFILYNRLKGELDNLTRESIKIKALAERRFGKKELQTAIAEFLIFCPIYKIYQAPSSFSETDKTLISSVFREVKKKNNAQKTIIEALEDLFFLRLAGCENEIQAVDTFFRHCMQFTGPLMAKGIEDTAFYSYNPFIGHNEVGDSPGYFGIRTETFHFYMKKRLDKRPLTMNAISTHDTKRGEDARARLNVLSDVPEKWIKATQKWRKLNKKYKQFDGKREIPTPNDEYLIYQVLCAHLPMDAKIDRHFRNRLKAYLVKAIREAKVNSSWSDPDEYYENKTLAFAKEILSSDSNFPEFFVPFMKELIPHGIINSITQLILKNTVPGMPDTFQGTETWNLNFVDPDNRRPVDYAGLKKQLNQIIEKYNSEPANLAAELWRKNSNGKIKLFFSWLTLNERIQNKDLFLKGNYIPLKAVGELSKNTICFLRSYKNVHLFVVLPLNTASLPEKFTWESTQIELPPSLPRKWLNIITKKTVIIDRMVKTDTIFDPIPFGIFVTRNL